MKPFLIGISYPDYVPGMKLCLHEKHESLNEGDIVVIKEMSGFDLELKTYKHPKELFFTVDKGVKIVWNKVAISCYIERNETTSFLEEMFDHYRLEADERMKDTGNYEWTQRNYDDYLEDKHTTLVEVLIAYEQKRAFN